MGPTVLPAESQRPVSDLAHLGALLGLCLQPQAVVDARRSVPPLLLARCLAALAVAHLQSVAAGGGGARNLDRPVPAPPCMPGPLPAPCTKPTLGSSPR
jgi:hypothetical protein